MNFSLINKNNKCTQKDTSNSFHSNNTSAWHSSFWIMLMSMWKLSPHSLGSIQLIDLLTFSCAVYRQESLTYTLQCYSSLSLRPLNPAIFTNLLTKASSDNIFWELSFYGSHRLWNDLYCVEWDVKTLLYHTIPYHTILWEQEWFIS